MPLEAAWAFAEIGRGRECNELLVRIEKELTSGCVKKIHKSRHLRGKTDPRLAILENGLRGVFKTEQYRNEIAAYRLDRLFGLNVVPVTIERELDGVVGSLQYLLRGAQTLKRARKKGVEIPALNEVDIQLLDYLTQNRDVENGSNTLVIDRRYKAAIDNGDAFPDAETGTLAMMECHSSPVIATRLSQIATIDVEAQLTGILTPSQIEGVLTRISNLI